MDTSDPRICCGQSPYNLCYKFDLILKNIIINTHMSIVFIFPTEILAHIKDYLFDYRKTFTKKILPQITPFYSTKIERILPRTSAIEVMNTGKIMFRIEYIIPWRTDFWKRFKYHQQFLEYRYLILNEGDELSQHIEGYSKS
jgi:hypothetical protein